MKITVKNINGKDYLYAYDAIFVAKGKSKPTTKSLGPVDSLIDETKKKQEFIEYIKAEEKKLRVAHWSKHLKNEYFSKYQSLEKIEKVRTELYRGKQNMGNIAASAMETGFLVDFIYNSNKIEGSKVPRTSIENAVRHGNAKQNGEVDNTIKAIYFIENKFTFSIHGIKQLHATLLAHEPDKLGFRKEKVIVGNYEVADWHEIKSKLKELLDWYEEARKTWYPPELAFTFYYRFERIHPFIDGNGRVGRLIMNRILKDQRYHPMIIWNSGRMAHLNAFGSALDGKMEKYYAFMIDQFVKTHNIYLEKIEHAFDLEKQLNYFLKPSKYS